MLSNIKALKSMDRYGLLVHGLSELPEAHLEQSLVTIQLAKHGVNQGSDALVNIMTGAVAYAAYTLLGSTLPELLGNGYCYSSRSSIISQSSRRDSCRRQSLSRVPMCGLLSSIKLAEGPKRKP